MVENAGKKSKAVDEVADNTTVHQTTNNNNSGPIAAKSLFSLMQPFSAPSQLSPLAVTFVDSMIKKLKEYNKPFVVTPISTDKYEARIVSMGNADAPMGIAIIFSETHNSLDNLPCSELTPEIAERYKKQFNGKLLSSLVATPYDYDRADKWATMLNASLNISEIEREEPMTVESISGMQFYCTTNQQHVRRYIDARSPHGVPPRDDIGLLLLAYNPQSGKRQDPNDLSAYLPIMAVTGYTEFVQLPTQFGNVSANPQFIPFVTISNIVSDMPSKSLIGMALPIAVDAFITKCQWLRPYSMYNVNDANIGSLIEDKATNQPYRVIDVAGRDEMIRNCMLAPQLAIDLTEGRARIPGLDRFRYKETTAVTDIGTFFGVDLSKSPNKAVIDAVQEYCGIVIVDGKPVDSRNIDYLSLAVHIKDPSRIARFKGRRNDPYERANQIREIFGDDALKLVYTNTKLVLDAGFVKFMAAQLQASLTIKYDTIASAGDWNIGGIINNNFSDFTGLNRNPTGGWAAQAGGISPFL